MANRDRLLARLLSIAPFNTGLMGCLGVVVGFLLFLAFVFAGLFALLWIVKRMWEMA